MTHGLFRFSIATAVALAISLTLGPSVAAQKAAPVSSASSTSTPRMPDGKPNLSGLWAETTDNGREQAVDDGVGNITREFPSRRCGPYQVNCDIRTNQSADGQLSGRYNPNRPLYKPEHWDRIQELDANTNFVDPIMKCQPHGVPRVGAPDKILQTPTEIVLFYFARTASTQPHDFRVIPIDGRKHDPERAKLEWTYYGYSVGYWEGDTLVVDSVAFNDQTWLARGGYFHSDQMRVLERFRRDENVLHYQATIEDPEVLLEPWVMDREQVKLNTDPNAYILEGQPCKDVDTENISLKIRH